jgi:hypothetical protein
VVSRDGDELPPPSQPSPPFWQVAFGQALRFRFLRDPSRKSPDCAAGMVRALHGLMPVLSNVSWADCLLAFRRAGFVRAAESPANVMLVSGGRTVLLQRVPVFDETVLRDALRSAGISGLRFVALLAEGVDASSDSSSTPAEWTGPISVR